MAGTISHNVSSFMAQGYGAQSTPIVIRWDIVLMLKRGGSAIRVSRRSIENKD